jgi:outer membrane protein OmpA-like peptidoglycan-associated protein
VLRSGPVGEPESGQKRTVKIMINKILPLIAAVCLVLTGCTSPMPRSEQGAAAGVRAGAALAEPLPAGKVAEYMNRQERELRQRLSVSQGTSVRRDRNNLTVTLSSDLLFDTDSTVLKAGTHDEIDGVVDVLKRYPQTHVRVNAFTDSPGSEAHNLALTRVRATAVRDAFIQGGIDPDRIKCQGFGESRPVRSNATESGRQMNRRVTVVIIPISL